MNCRQPWNDAFRQGRFAGAGKTTENQKQDGLLIGRSALVQIFAEVFFQKWSGPLPGQEVAAGVEHIVEVLLGIAQAIGAAP